MTNGLLAATLVWFIILNFITHALFARSHKRVALRQSALSGALLTICAIIGGAPAAFVAWKQFRNIPNGVLAAPLMSLLAVVQCGLLGVVIVDLLVVDII